MVETKRGKGSMFQGFDFNQRPFLVIWETTRACDLACVHCRASADPNPAPDELTHEEALRLIREVREMGSPILIFSGGDCLKRTGLLDLIFYAKSLGLRTGAIPAVTPLLTLERIQQLKACGLDQMAVSLDAARAEDHDAFRRVSGVFDRTLEAIRTANACGLAVQVNSLVNLHNMEQLDPLLRLVENLGIVFWEVFFLVPVGRGTELSLLEACRFEDAFEKIYTLSQRTSFVIKITEAPHYRRFYFEKEIQRLGLDLEKALSGTVELPASLRRNAGPRGTIGHAPQGVNAGKGFLFVSHRGEVFPSGFLPLEAGRFREKPLGEIYRESPLLKKLRDASLLKGRCGRCPYKEICGGSRSRAFALTGDYLAEDPSCAYDPERRSVTPHA